MALPMPRTRRMVRLKASSSRGLAVRRRWASTSLMWACSKNRSPERTTKGMPRRESSTCSSMEWWWAR